MIKQVYVCDCCGLEIQGGFYKMAVQTVDGKGESVGNGPAFDVCQECFQAFTEQANRHLKNEEPKPKKKAPEVQKKQIDAGKIGALYDAGWPTKEIAAEMGISVPTALKYINRHKKEIGGE